MDRQWTDNVVDAPLVDAPETGKEHTGTVTVQKLEAILPHHNGATYSVKCTGLQLIENHGFRL